MRIHPQTIIEGWRNATKVARGVLEANVSEISHRNIDNTLMSFRNMKKRNKLRNM